MSKISVIIMIWILSLSMLPFLSPKANSPSETLDTIVVNPDGLTYYSTIALQTGVKYVIEATGAFNDDTWPDHQTDAIYYTKDGWTTHHMNDLPGYEGLPTGGLYMAGWAYSYKPWGSYSSEHRYHYTIVGAGEIVGFWIYDSYEPGGPPGQYGDDSGSITVKILDEAPIGLWKFDEGSGSVACDSSGNGNDGLVTGAEWVQGVSGSALRFRDSTTYVTMQRFPDGLAGNTEFTVSFWVQVFTWPSQSQQYSYLILFGQPWVIDRSFHVILCNDAPYSPYGTVRPGFFFRTEAYTSHTFSTGIWYNWAFVYDKTRVRMYQNGAFLEDVSLGGATPDLDPSGVLMLSKLPSLPVQYFDGILDEVAIYNYARTAEEIQRDHYAVGRVHNTNSGLSYNTIQEAIDAPETLNGHEILVDPGTYNENVVVSKSLSIVAASRDYPTIDGCGSGISLWIKTDHVTISGFSIRNVGRAFSCIVADYSSDVHILNNYIADGDYGIGLYGSSNNIIQGNYIRNNNQGIRIKHSSNNNLVLENNVEDNGYGIWLWQSAGNIVYHNNLLNNGFQVYIMDVLQNMWDNGYPSGGNYWSNYTGIDLRSGPAQDQSGNDGIGDVSYDIVSNNIDNYPLKQPFATISLLNYGKVFQLTLELTAGAWGRSGSQYLLTMKDMDTVIGTAIDVAGLLAENMGATKVAWVCKPIDTDGDGNLDSELRNCVQESAITIAEELYWTYRKEDLEFWATVAYYGLNSLMAGLPALLISQSGALKGAIVAPPVGPLVGPPMIVMPYMLCAGWVLPGAPQPSICDTRFMSGQYQYFETQCPVELEITTSSGLVLNSTINQISGSEYVTRDLDGDGEEDARVLLPNITESYSYRIIPKPGANPSDNFTLIMGAGEFSLTLVKDCAVENMSTVPYSLSVYNQTAIDDVEQRIRGKPNIVVLGVVPCKPILGEGYCFAVNVTIENQGDSISLVNLTAYANMTFITKTENIVVENGTSKKITIMWNTTNWTKGDYSVYVYTWPLLGEINLTDNMLASNLVRITIPGDTNGDRKVDLKDAYAVGRAFGTTRQGPNPQGRVYVPNCDLNDDGKIDLKDYYTTCKNYGKSW